VSVPDVITICTVAILGGIGLRMYADRSDRLATRMAEHRWRRINRRAKRAGCPCGKPANRVEYHDGALGRVRPETWTCLEHGGAAMWIGARSDDDSAYPRYEMIALWSHPFSCPLGDVRGTTGVVGGAQKWMCPHRDHADVTWPDVLPEVMW
jgi:hypothetical protein